MQYTLFTFRMLTQSLIFHNNARAAVYREFSNKEVEVSLVSAHPHCARSSFLTPRHVSLAGAEETFLQSIGLVVVSLSWR